MVAQHLAFGPSLSPNLLNVSAPGFTGYPAQPAEPPEYSALNWNEVWRNLVNAHLRFRSALWSEGRCVVVFRQGGTQQRHFALTARERSVLERTLRGDRQKLIASDARVATSTVANCLKSAMLKLGFQTRLDAAPLAALCLTHRNQSYVSDPLRPVLSVGHGEFVIATAPEPNWHRLPRVTHSERAICAWIIQGKSNTDVATLRQTSVHTVENQVASLFRKVGASGRFDLLRVLYGT